MSKRRTRPTFITEEPKLATCETCNIKDLCGLYKYVIQMAIMKNRMEKDNKSDNVHKAKKEFGCTWHSDYAEDEVKSY